MKSFPIVQYRILRYLFDKQDKSALFSRLAQELDAPSSQIHGDCVTLQDMGLIGIQEQAREELIWKGPDDAGELPEKKLVQALRDLGGKGSIPDVAKASGLPTPVVGKTLKVFEAKGYGKNERGTLMLAQELAAGPLPRLDDERLIDRLKRDQRVYVHELTDLDYAQAMRLLKPRSKWFNIKQRTVRSATLTAAGSALLLEGIKPRQTVTELDASLLVDEGWRDVEFKAYNLNDRSEDLPMGKVHPMTRVINKVRGIFLEMGFEEIRYGQVESSFWNFDALFQPQNHPAREMQDTFYLDRPAVCRLPDKDLLQQVRAVHENGADTGSKGWGYHWREDVAKQAVLRTHTTVATIRTLAQNPESPRKVFLVGKVFRRETVDYKHLPFFYQVDGIIIDEKANFSNLLGTLDVFYRKMGFDKFYFRPGFFPYTEPSVEVFVYNEKKKDWMEMGGAGVFRPEVTRPLGCDVPVLAWGLGLERIAMFLYDVDFIKDLYISDLKWLQEVPLCP